MGTGAVGIFTAEPNGAIYSWSASSPLGPLQRQMFTADHTGKAWHALKGVKIDVHGEGLVGLMVDPTNPSSCNVIFWAPQAVLSSPQFGIIETPPGAAVLPSDHPLGAIANVTNRLWDAEGNLSTPFLQFQVSGSTNWSTATVTKLDGAPYDTAIRVSALPTGVNHTLTWNAMADLGPAVVTNVLLRARAQDFMLVGGWSLPTLFQIDMIQDSNTNGIPDWWEYHYFSSLQPANGDFDGDGASNYAEYISDTDPTDRISYLRITSAQVSTNGVQVFWSGGSQARQYLQRISSIDGTDVWMDLATNQAPTPLTGTFQDVTVAATNKATFYRIRVERP